MALSKSTLQSLQDKNALFMLIKTGKLADFESLLDKTIEANKLTIFENLRDCTNNTILHIAVWYEAVDIVKCILNKMSTEAKTFCKLINNDGNTPLDLTYHIQNQTDRELVTGLLLPKTLPVDIKPLQELVQVDTVLEEFPETKSQPKLQYHLKLACESINLCRQDVADSYTHPATNSCSSERKTEINAQILSLRDEVRSNPLFTVDLSMQPREIRQTYRSLIKKIRSVQTANCGEFANIMCGYILMLTKGYSVKIEEAVIKNGDHQFNIIGRYEHSDINKPATWGPNAVVADAWAGKAYPAKRLFTELMDYKLVELEEPQSLVKSTYNILTYFNSSYHRLESVKTFEVSIPGKSPTDYKSIDLEERISTHSFFTERGHKRKPEADYSSVQPKKMYKKAG